MGSKRYHDGASRFILGLVSIFSLVDGFQPFTRNNIELLSMPSLPRRQCSLPTFSSNKFQKSHWDFQVTFASKSVALRGTSTQEGSAPPTTGEVESECAYIEQASFQDGTKPESAFTLAANNFARQGSSILKEFFEESVGLKGKSYIPRSEMPPDCLGFTLDNEAVRVAERKREARRGEKVETNPASKLLYDIGCFALDELFPGRPIARFWFLETIARIPYFSYVSMLHLYESFGWWRQPQLRKVHYAEEDNELHHLLIMESLGGNARWRDRFLGYHVAIAYYWAVNALFLFSPRAAYEFMELLEAHAVDTYTTFYKENEERLKALPAPNVAISYYKGADLYFFDDFQVSKTPRSRRPPCDTLHDVFKNISEDEGEHVRTMRACKDYAKLGDIVVSPHWNTESDAGLEKVSEEKRQAWLEWSEEVNRACTAEEDF